MDDLSSVSVIGVDIEYYTLSKGRGVICIV
jgi:hypothetical protein